MREVISTRKRSVQSLARLRRVKMKSRDASDQADEQLLAYYQ